MGDGPGTLERIVLATLDKVNELQEPFLRGYIDLLRKIFPNDTPEEFIGKLEFQYIVAVTGAGAGSGALAAFPGVGTIASLAAAGAETAFFLDASALLTLAIAHIHGIHPDAEERKALVLGVILGEAGGSIISRGAGRAAKNWPEQLAEKIPGIGNINDSLMKKFLVSFATKRVALMAGSALPAGIGAVIGGVGNRAMGKTIIENAQRAFGPAPANWPDAVIEGEVVDEVMIEAQLEKHLSRADETT